MKKRWRLVFLVLALGMSGCANKNKESDVRAESVVEAAQVCTSQDVSAKETKKTEEEDGNTSKSKDHTTDEFDENSVIEVAMGPSAGASSSALCKVKIPASYYIAGEETDSAGNTKAIGAAVVPQVGTLDLGDRFFTKACVRSEGTVNGTYDFEIYPTSEYTVEDVETSMPNGIEIEHDSFHPAYITDAGRYEALFVYALDENWVLAIGYDGDLTEQMSLNDLGKKFYEMIVSLK